VRGNKGRDMMKIFDDNVTLSGREFSRCFTLSGANLMGNCIVQNDLVGCVT